jgi:NAD-dependent deacetylase
MNLKRMEVMLACVKFLAEPGHFAHKVAMTFSRVDVRQFHRVVFFTGAGMSAESGVPTYRGKGGIWKEYDWQQYACQPAFERDPERVWEFHNYRRTLVAECKPNRGHDLIARAEKDLPSVVVVTQNIDGLHQRAGSTNVLELHGSLWRTRCPHCRKREHDPSAPIGSIRCECGEYKRPDIVWFGDSLFPDVIQAVEVELTHCDLLISIGTSAVVYPAAEMPMIAKAAGATLVEINPEETPMSAEFDVCLRGSATEMLAQLF